MTQTITEFEGSQFRDLIEGFLCPVDDGECGQLIRFSSFEDGKSECPRCGTELQLQVEVTGDGREPTTR